MRKSSVHFKQVANASVAIAHSTRTEETEPAYLLPKEHRLGNVIVPGSMSNIELGLEFTRAKASMTGQAKARGSSPFWEGVVVLDGTDMKAQTAKLQSWKKEYEKATGQRVLHMAIHGDEGFINSEGKPEYNIHAHVIVNRLNDKGRVIKLERKQLSEVQDLTATSLGMQRGETLEERKGMRGRKHLNHREFKAQANEKRLDAEHNIGATQTLQERIDILTPQANKLHGLRKELAGEPERLRLALVAEKYRLDREEFKRLNAEAAAAGLDKPISQKDYQKLKKERDDAVAELKATKEKVEKMEKQITQLTDEKAQLEAQAAKWAAKTAHRDAELAKGVPWTDIDTTDVVAPDPRTSQSNKPEVRTPAPMPPEATRTAVEQPKAVVEVIPSPAPVKTPREAFLALWAGVKMVALHVIDGCRLDAAEGRLGLFSWPNKVVGGRNQVLCEVPSNQVMPKIGEVFDSRAVPGKSKGVGR